MTRPTPTPAIARPAVEMAEVLWMIEILEERDARICALLNAIGNIIPPDTYEHTLYLLAFEMSEDESNWARLRETLGFSKAGKGGAA